MGLAKKTIPNRLLSPLLTDLPEGVAVPSAWLTERGISPQLVRKYVASGWLTPLAHGAYARPASPVHWQGVVLALQRLKEAAEKATNDIRKREGELVEKDIPYDFPHTNYGVLGRYDVANTLRNSDIFLDFSTFQAFGRTALEAMSCGAAVVAPREGGVQDFGVDGENILLIDTKDEEACFKAACSLIDDAALRHKLGASGIQKGLEYSLHGSALEFLEWAVEISQPSTVSPAARQLAG